MIDRQKLSLILLTGTVAISRFVFRSRYLYELDSVNFALAMERFDPRVHQPHPPGYFLYICLGRQLPKAIPEATWTTERSVYVPLHPGMVPVNSRSH